MSGSKVWALSIVPDYFQVSAGEAFRSHAKICGLKKKKTGPTNYVTLGIHTIQYLNLLCSANIY